MVVTVLVTPNHWIRRAKRSHEGGVLFRKCNCVNRSVLRFSYSQGKMRSMVIDGTDALIVNCGILVVR